MTSLLVERRFPHLRSAKRVASAVLAALLTLSSSTGASADSGAALATATFATVANPCAAGETWIKPIRIVLLADGGSINEYNKSGLIVGTPQPPAAFDPQSASEADLAAYGFPERPTGVDDLKQWQGEMAAWRPTKDLRECQTARRATIYNNEIWSGYDADSTSSTYYRAVQGDYQQPSKHATTCSPNEEVSWVGLGGYHAAKLIRENTVKTHLRLGLRALREALPD